MFVPVILRLLVAWITGILCADGCVALLGPESSIGFILFLYVALVVVYVRARQIAGKPEEQRKGLGEWRSAAVLLLIVALGFLRERQVMDDAQPFTATLVDRTSSRFLPDSLITNFRTWCLGCIDSHHPDEEVRSLVQGCILGDRTGASRHMLRAFNYSGMGHLLAVSGLHLGLIALFITALLFPMRLLPGGARLERVCGLLLMWCYVLLIGSPPSAVRAALMITMCRLSWVLSRGVHDTHNLCLAAWVLLLYDPRLLYHISFQLSFVAVAALLFWRENVLEFIDWRSFMQERWRYFTYRMPGVYSPWIFRRKKWLYKVWSMFLVSILLQASLLPLMLHYFHHVTVVGCLQTFLVLPMLSVHMSLILLCLLVHAWAGWMPLCSDVALFVARICWAGIDGCARWMLGVAEWCQQMDVRLFGDVSWHLSTTDTLCCYALFLTIYLGRKQLWPRWKTVAIGIVLLMAFG
jgi:ComEC/Rec2-related protein